MQESDTGSSKKLLENPVLGSLVVPVAIVLIGALIIFGVTKMISTDQGYKDLVREMQSKKFGNRWIAAYELSKLISTNKIPDEDVDWLISELSSLYVSSSDPRTKEFIIVAAGAMKKPQALPVLLSGLAENDSKVKFHALVAIANMPKGSAINWEKVSPYLEDSDRTLRLAAILAIATHKVAGANIKMRAALASSDLQIRYAAATGLINYRDQMALPVIQKIMNFELGEDHFGFDLNQQRQLKMNVISAYEREQWVELKPLVVLLDEQKDGSLGKNTDKEIMTMARKVLNKLKK